MESHIQSRRRIVSCQHPGRRYTLRTPASLSCPHCGFQRLIDTGQRTASQTYTPDEDGYDDADYYQKCRRCSTEIGIKKI